MGEEKKKLQELKLFIIRKNNGGAAEIHFAFCDITAHF